MPSSWRMAVIRHEYILQTGESAHLLFAARPLTQWIACQSVFLNHICFNCQTSSCGDIASSPYHSEWTSKLSASCLAVNKSSVTASYLGEATEGSCAAWAGCCWLQDSTGTRRVETRESLRAVVCPQVS